MRTIEELKKSILEKVDLAEDRNRFGGDEDGEGGLLPDFVDWKGLRDSIIRAIDLYKKAGGK